MANPTTNYGFVLPTSSDLVTDLPADFDVALQGVDTRLKALQPGTTLGDLAYTSASANTNTRLGVGSTGQVLTVSGGVPAWTTITAGSMTSLATGSLTGASVSLTSISQAYKDLYLILDNVSISTNGQVGMTINNITTTSYNAGVFYSNSATGVARINAAQNWPITYYNTGAAQTNQQFAIQFPNYTNANSSKMASALCAYYAVDNTTYSIDLNNLTLIDNAAITRLDIIATVSGAYTFDSGTYTLYGVK
jgi:hypothetical protein